MSSALSTHPACGCIDVHHHHGTPEFAQFMADTPSDRAFPPNTWRVEEALADMDEAGVRTAILSQFPPYHLSTAARRKALDRKSTRLNSSHYCAPRMPSSACNQHIKH